MFLDCAGRGGRWNWGEVSIFTHRPNGDEVGDDKSRPVDLLMRGVEYMCATYMRAGSAGASGEDVVNSNDKKTRDVESHLAELCMRLVKHMCGDGLHGRLARKTTPGRTTRGDRNTARTVSGGMWGGKR